MKRTVLYENHLALGAKMVEFAGYEMPIEYSGLTSEHLAVRNSCGVFDVSHMGEILISGKDALAFCNYILSARLPIAPFRMNYALLLNHEGTIKDDLMAYVYNEEKILLIVNASNLLKDLAWIIEAKGTYKVKITDLSPATSQLALQGPNAYLILQEFTPFALEALKLFDFREIKLNDCDFLVSRSGYTGEDGFEIYGANQDIANLFTKLIARGVIPCGLGCRDTLRFEAAMPLYGHETSEDINPFVAALGFAVDMSKDDFIGKKALEQIKAKGIKQKVVALEIMERGIARSGYLVYANGEEIGVITTGYLLPGHERALAFAMLKEGYLDLGTKVEIQIRKNLVSAQVRNKKFLNKKYIH